MANIACTYEIGSRLTALGLAQEEGIVQSQYQKLLLRLQREKMLAPKSGWRASPIWERATGAIGLLPGVIPWKSPVMWGLTATFLIGAAVVVSLQNSAPSSSDEDILRGGKVTAQIVEQPELRLNQLLQGLRAAGEEPVIERVSNGSIILKVTSSPRVLDYLDTQRIIPAVVEGKITLLLMRPKAATKQK